MLTDGRTTDAGVTGILIAHLGAFGSGELKSHLELQMEITLRLTELAPNPYFFVKRFCLV